MSDAVITNSTDLSSGVFGGGNIDIGSASQAANLTLAPDYQYTGNSVVTGIEDIALNNTDSSVTLDSTNYPAGFFSFQDANISAGNLSFASLVGLQDGDGKVTLKAINNQLQVYASQAQSFSAYFGRPYYNYSDSNGVPVILSSLRLQSLTITGNRAVTIDNVNS